MNMNFKDYLEKSGDELVQVDGYGRMTRSQANDSAILKAKEILTSLESGNEVTRGQFMLLEGFYQASRSTEVARQN